MVTATRPSYTWDRFTEREKAVLGRLESRSALLPVDLYPTVVKTVRQFQPVVLERAYENKTNCDRYTIDVGGVPVTRRVVAGQYRRYKAAALDLLFGAQERKDALRRGYACEIPRYSTAQGVCARAVALLAIARDCSIEDAWRAWTYKPVHDHERLEPVDPAQHGRYDVPHWSIIQIEHDGEERTWRERIPERQPWEHALWSFLVAACETEMYWRVASLYEPDEVRTKSEFGVGWLAYNAMRAILWDLLPEVPRD